MSGWAWLWLGLAVGFVLGAWWGGRPAEAGDG